MSEQGRLRALRRRIGRRGAALLYFAIVNVLYALGMLSAPPPLNATFQYFGSVAPLSAWAAGWMGAGLIAAYHAFHRYDHFGFVALMGIYMVWGVGCFFGWVSADVPIGGVAIWLGLVCLVFNISGWPEPQPREAPPDGL